MSFIQQIHRIITTCFTAPLRGVGGLWALLALGFICLSCDSGDIYPQTGGGEKNANRALRGEFVFSETNRLPPNYRLVLAAFEDNSHTPLVWTAVLDPEDGKPVALSLANIPPQAATVRLCLLTIGRRAIYDFYLCDISTADADVQIPPQALSLKMNYHKIQDLFNRSCAACHGERPAAGLPLEEGQSHAALVNQPAARSPKLRVEPHSLPGSFLIEALTDLSANLRQPHTTILYPDDVHLLKAWIEAGAEP